MALFGNITKYKEKPSDNYKSYPNYTRDHVKDGLIQEAIKEARMLGFTENCRVILLTGEEAMLTSFNTLQSLAFDAPSDYIPKVCRVFYSKNSTTVYDNIDHNELELFISYKNKSYG
jgi:hypothetical protein